MSRKTFFIIVISFLLLIVIGFGIFFFLFIKNDPQNNNSFVKTILNLFPSASTTTLPTKIKNDKVNNDFDNKQVVSATSTDVTSQKEVVIPRLRQIWREAIAGDVLIEKSVIKFSTSTVSTVINSKTSTSTASTTATTTSIVVKKATSTQTVIRYIDRSTGNLYEANDDTLSILRISNKTIPKVYEAYFDQKGENVILRGLRQDSDVIETLYASLRPKVFFSATSTVSTVSNLKVGTSTASTTKITTASAATSTEKELVITSTFPFNIKDISVSPLLNQVYYLTYTDSTSEGTVANIDGTKRISLLSSPIREWLPQWATNGIINITTKASYYADGYSYALDPKTGRTRKLFGGIQGLTTLMSTDGAHILYSRSQDGGFRTYVYDTKTKESKPFFLTTLPEKCVWGRKNKNLVFCSVPTSIAQNTYPDVWYKSRVSFSDVIWKVDLDTGQSIVLSNLPKEAGEEIDGVNLKVNAEDGYLTFMNKKDLSLWGLDVK